MPDYHRLDVGNSTSLVTGVQIRLWGSEVLVQCLYDPLARRPYILLFTECREVCLSVHEPEAVKHLEADLIGILLGENEHRQPAVITTDIFELSLSYGHFEIRKTEEESNKW